MLCFVQVSLQTHNPDTVLSFRQRIADMPEVLECHQLIGDIDYLLKVVIRNKGDLQRFLMERITPIPGVSRIKTSMALTEIKSTTVLPVQPAADTINED
jgi:DNA-binding Lrp family transcriptional regulator